MKKTLLAITIASALGALAVQAEGHGGHGGGKQGPWGDPLGHLTKELNLTPDQQAKVAPIVDQAKPQIIAIHQEAMQKTQAVMETSAAQIRPLLTPEQQTKFDSLRKAHGDMMKARMEMREARKK